MKNIIFSFIALLVLHHATAQKTLTEGSVTFAISYPSLPDQMKEHEAMLPKTMTATFKGSRCRYEFPSPLGTTSSITDLRTKENTLLMDIMGQKFAHKTVAADNDTTVKKGKNSRVVILKDEKMIAGYKCKKAIMIVGTETSEYYFTADLPKVLSSGTSLNKNTDIDIPGFPMEYSVTQNGLKMVMVAKSVKEEAVADATFAIPAGYQIMTAEDLKQLFESKELIGK